ncbi:MAG TPA: Yip1 family protein [Usitatibacter sp.]|nr:Yip1 family protein [Usitatibacter sp.]
MNLVERAKNILLTPKTEWAVIEAEPTQPKELILNYVLPLAALAAVMHFLSLAVIGTHTVLGGVFHMGYGFALMMAVYQLVMAVVAVFVIGFIIDALAPSFGGTKNMNQATKVAAYAFTASWVGSVFGIIPWLGPVLMLLFGLYGLYLLYLGLPQLMKNPADKSIGYTAVVVIAAIVVMVVIGVVGGMFTGGAMLAGGMAGASFSGPRVSSSSSVTYDANSPMGKLEAYGKRMEEANKKMDAAQKSGDANAQVAAAMAAAGAALGGKPGVEPVQIDALKPFVPDTFAGLPRKDMRTERGGVAGLMTAKAEGVYNDGAGKNADLEVVDTGGASGLMGLAAWMNVQAEREDQYRKESTRKENGRLVHEEVNKQGGSNKYAIVLNERFIVTARGNVPIDALKSSVASLDLGKLESLK